ncbi:MAG: hypothetical protein AB7N71_06325 [Phycisphaerae bacterium]
MNAKPGHVAHEAIHNVIPVTDSLISGSVPEGEEGFAALAKRGVRTVISVDGAKPDVAAAHRHGMRYVHLPIGYHGIDPSRQMEIARAVHDLPGPIYVHCHHGKHRGPAATATAAVLLNLLTADEALAFMKKAGTSDNYAGLYACVSRLSPATTEQIERANAEFPEAAPVPNFVAAMAQAQEAYDHLVEIRDAEWNTPANHPDLVPLDEAGLLENLLRGLRTDPERDRHPSDFAEMLDASWVAARDFERALFQKMPHEELTVRLRAVDVSCKNCHTLYRNNR